MKCTGFTFHVIVIGIILLLPLSVSAQDKSNYIVIKGGIYTPTDDLDDADFDTGFYGEIALGGHYNQYFAAELGVGYFKTDTSGIQFEPVLGLVDEDDEVTALPLTVTVKGIYPVGSLELFLGLGLGVYFTEVEVEITTGGLKQSETESDTVFGGHLLAGGNINISRSVFFGMEGRYIWTDEAEFDATLFGIPFTGNLNLTGYTVTGTLGFRF